MARYVLVTLGLALLFLALFGVVEGLGVAPLTDPLPLMEGGGAPAAALGVGLLVADVFLPVPSSLVMTAHGALFGVVVGTALSWLGGLGAATLGFALGRRGGPLVERLVTPPQAARAAALLADWGWLAIAVSRPVPIVAETVAILAGAGRMRWSTALGATALGTLPGAYLYALAGASAERDAAGLVLFGVVMASAAVVWWIGRRWSRVVSPGSRGP